MIDGPARASRALLAGWGLTAPTAAYLLRPSRPRDLDRLLASRPNGGLIARGLGRSYGDAAQNAGGLVVDCLGLDRILELDLERGFVTAEGGVSLDRLMRLLLPAGWFLPVTPGTRFVTVGGAIAADIHGKNHHRDGSFCEHVVSMTVRSPAGRIAATRETRPEVFWATAGGMGLTGVVESATIALRRVETAWIRRDVERAADVDECLARLEAADRSRAYSVAWVDCCANGRRLGRAVLELGDHAAASELRERRRSRALDFSPRAALTAPAVPTGGVLRPATAQSFNTLYFASARRRRSGVVSLGRFFHPLDGIGQWNRFYGRGGFAQYQFSVPLAEDGTLRRVLERLSRERAASPLALLKRFRGSNPGPLSFPSEGWSLGADVFIREPVVRRMLDELDELVAAAGGRVYLAKDSRLRPDAFAAMYPRRSEFDRVRAALDPDGMLASDLSRRIGLT